ncbi:MAG: hypothetical protein P4K86_13475 [Terracidiphilus sp.]|nr:hypothetical protein [Terracidiphilus sp.]
MIEPELVRQADEAFQVFDNFIRSLRPTDEEAGRFYHVISALSSSAKTNYVTLRQAFEDDEQTLMAWSCRNLLELAIYTKFALSSKANADEFVAARLFDVLQIGTSLRELELYLNPELMVSTFDGLIDRSKKQMKEEGITPTKFLDARELARKVGMLEVYSTMNKVCSKFVHPTAWSLLTADIGTERFPEARDVFYVCGTEYFMTIFAEINPHVRKWGLKHKPD